MKHSTLSLWIACFALPFGCNLDVDEGLQLEPSVESNESASVINTTNRWEENAILVCWVNPDSTNSAARTAIQNAVTTEYGTKTRVFFYGWGACGNNGFAHVRIRIADERPHSHVGPIVRGETMLLNTTYQSFSKGASWRMIPDAIHEFGHTIGLYHDQDRSDSPCRDEPKDHEDDDAIFGPYDSQSVMNYCVPLHSTLSSGDVLAIKALFGSPGKFLQEGNAIYRYTRPTSANPKGTRCHVINPTQLDAFGGAKIIRQPVWNDWKIQGAKDLGECLWPDGFYRDERATYFATDGDSENASDRKLCWVESPVQMNSMGGPQNVMPVTDGSFFNGRTNAGTCAWADGFYRAENTATVYQVTGNTYCHVPDPESQNVLGGFGIVRVVPQSATYAANRTNTGACVLGRFDIKNPQIGTFAGWAQTRATKAVTGDFNGDGLDDVALVGGRDWNTLPIAFSNGDTTFRVTNTVIGEFSESWAVTAGAKPVVGDFDADGDSDIALVGGKGWTTLPIAFSNRDGTFRVTNSSIGEFSSSWAQSAGATPVAGDFNGDGDSDIALVGGKGWNTLPVAQSNRDGTFRVSNQYTGEFSSSWAQTAGARPVAGDFDKDGDADLALVGGQSWNTIPLGFSNGDGSFRVTNKVVTEFAEWAAHGAKVITGDFDGDGDTDIALAGGPQWLTIPIALSMNNGGFDVENRLAPHFRVWSTDPGAHLLAGRFNRDSKWDLALVGGKDWTTLPLAFNR